MRSWCLLSVLQDEHCLFQEHEGELMKPLNVSRTSAAFAFAARAHAGQFRKGTDIPYISHPMAVASQVLVWGGDEDQFIAALLHDVIEDAGAAYAAEIGSNFGPEVLRMVHELSDAEPEKGEQKAPWIERKRTYVEHLAACDEKTLLVSAADKWHNLTSILDDVRRCGDAVYARFVSEEPEIARKKLLTLENYERLIEVYEGRGIYTSSALRLLLEELRRA